VLVLNEKKPRVAFDWYTALDRLVAEGGLTEYKVVPYLSLLADGATPQEVVERVVQDAGKMEAHHVLWAHTHGLPVPRSALTTLRDLVPDSASAYWDGDWYHWYRAPFPSDVRT